MLAIYTIGHSTRPLTELIAMLQAAGVTCLADVRGIPRSRTNPQFDLDSLPAALAQAAIEYRHLPALGGRRARQQSVPPERNALWRNQAFHNYADYAATDAFRAGLRELQALARQRVTAIMCAEALWWRCHRRLVADYLLLNGWDVIHLMAPGKMEPASLTPGAVQGDNGTLVYPADSAQPSLF
jgi:uncharacterized protein (DUF488 family)